MDVSATVQGSFNLNVGHEGLVAILAGLALLAAGVPESLGTHGCLFLALVVSVAYFVAPKVWVPAPGLPPLPRIL